MSDERLHAYLDQELSDDERATLERELAADAGLRARLEHLRAVDGELLRYDHLVAGILEAVGADPARFLPSVTPFRGFRV